jgi:hypothetical protein
MVSLPVFEVDPWWMASCFIGKDKGSRGSLARMFTVTRLFDAACIQGNNPILQLFPPHWGAPMIVAPATAGTLD